MKFRSTMSIPKPVLTFTVGVTGHRAARLKDEHRGRIARQLGDVFANIEAECRAELDRNRGLYAEEAPRLQLITSLADGADAMAVQQCPSNWTSVGILPYPEERYIAELRGNDRSSPDEGAVAAYKSARERTSGHVVDSSRNRGITTPPGSPGRAVCCCARSIFWSRYGTITRRAGPGEPPMWSRARSKPASP